MDCQMAHMMAEHNRSAWDNAYPSFNTDEHYGQNASENQYPGWYLHYDDCNENDETETPCVRSNDSHWAYLMSRGLMMNGDSLGYPSTPAQQAGCSDPYTDRSWHHAPSADTDAYMINGVRAMHLTSDAAPVSPTFPARSPIPYPLLHTDEAFALMQRQSSNYIPSISVALDAPVRNSVDSSLSPSRSATPPPTFPSVPITPELPQAKSEPVSPVMKVGKPHVRETRSRTSKEASAKPDSSCLYTKYRFREVPTSSGSRSEEEEEDDIPLLPQINGDAVEKAKRGLARARRTQHLACYFCRRRKIACVAPDTADPDRTCNQCDRRGLACSFPAESHRGLRHRSRDKKLAGQDEGTS